MRGGVGTRRDGHVGGVDLPGLVVAGEVVQLPLCTDVVSDALGHVVFHGVAGGFVEGRLGVEEGGRWWWVSVRARQSKTVVDNRATARITSKDKSKDKSAEQGQEY